MFLLLFFISLIQLFSFWIFKLPTIFLTSFVEARNLPILILAFLVFLFSGNNSASKK